MYVCPPGREIISAILLAWNLWKFVFRDEAQGAAQRMTRHITRIEEE